MTRAAIRKYQAANQLTVNGRLDQQTLNSLGVQNQGEANRSAEPAQSQSTQAQPTPAQPPENQPGQSQYPQSQSQSQNQPAESNSVEPNAMAPSTEAISAAQRRLREKGLYKGDIDGQMRSETEAVIREYRTNSNLNVSGQLDAATLSHLGISK